MEEILNLSELNTRAELAPSNNDPDRNRLDLSGVINNTFIEDQVLANPEFSQNQTVLQNLQLSQDLQARANILEQRSRTASEDLANALGGRQFAGPGQRNALAQRRNVIDAERNEVAAALSEVRGNLSTAASLRSEANRLRGGTSSSSSSSSNPLDLGIDGLRDGKGGRPPEEQKAIELGDTNLDGVVDAEENRMLEKLQIRSQLIESGILSERDKMIVSAPDVTLTKLRQLEKLYIDGNEEDFRFSESQIPERTLTAFQGLSNPVSLVDNVAEKVYKSIFD